MPVNYKLYTITGEMFIEILDGEFIGSRFFIKNFVPNNLGKVIMNFDITSEPAKLTEGKDDLEVYGAGFRNMLHEISMEILGDVSSIREKILKKEIEEYVIQPLAQE